MGQRWGPSLACHPRWALTWGSALPFLSWGSGGAWKGVGLSWVTPVPGRPREAGVSVDVCTCSGWTSGISAFNHAELVSLSRRPAAPSGRSQNRKPDGSRGGSGSLGGLGAPEPQGPPEKARLLAPGGPGLPAGRLLPLPPPGVRVRFRGKCGNLPCSHIRGSKHCQEQAT